ncbi:hypothetical protein AKJ16_DCAP13824 [Drosera capensis]
MYMLQRVLGDFQSRLDKPLHPALNPVFHANFQHIFILDWELAGGDFVSTRDLKHCLYRDLPKHVTG